MLSDYIAHVRKEHERSYHLLKHNRMHFKWQLPVNQTQEDKGIMSHRLGFIFYKIVYKREFQSLLYSIYNLHESNTQFSFVIRLIKGDRVYKIPTYKSLNIKHINDSIVATNNLIIHKDVLLDYTDENRYFLLSFEIL